MYDTRTMLLVHRHTRTSFTQVALVHYDHERLEATFRVPERRAAADATAHRRVPRPLRLLFTAFLI